jgi:Amt family ammonium transporter
MHDNGLVSLRLNYLAKDGRGGCTVRNRLLSTTYFLIVLLLAMPGWAWASGQTVSPGDTAFMMFATALVFLMIPGLALFYGGMVRQKNVLSTIMHSFILIGVISLQWVLFGYTIAFGPDKYGLFGSLAWLGLKGVGLTPNPGYAATIPHLAFATFQMMFAIITVALISGSFAERMRFPAFLLFSVLWATIIYDPLAHWVWGSGGWLHNLGLLDFAGGTVVHISAGISGLVVALVLGRRLGLGSEPMMPHDLPMTVLGAGLLWFGWFGFNAGSALAANGVAVNAFMVTNTAAAAGTVAWVITEWLSNGRPTMLGAASGCIAGLGTITPASGFVSPMAAIAIGLVAGVVCYFAVSVLKARLRYDDSLDVFGVHGVGGTMGVLATGLFASTVINPAGANGLFFGNPHQLLIQAIGAAVTICWAGIGTFILLKVVSLFTRLRVDAEDERTGLDLPFHGERAYDHA